VAVAIDEVILAGVPRRFPDIEPGRLWPRDLASNRFGGAFLLAALIVGVIGAVRAPTGIGSPLHALAPANRDALAWIAAESPPDAEFVVISGGSWFIDPSSEWFPVLTGRRSVATVQGYEWLGKQAFDEQLDRSFQLQVCTWVGADCVADWLRRYEHEAAWLYVPRSTLDSFASTGDCCAVLRAALAASGDYDVVYAAEGGAIFRPRT
jgi:hypothetical protein